MMMSDAKRERPWTAAERVSRRQRGLGMNLVEILDDHRGLDHRFAVMNQRGHNPVGIELEILGRQMVAGGEMQDVAFPVQPLLGETDPDLLAACRMV